MLTVATASTSVRSPPRHGCTDIYNSTKVAVAIYSSATFLQQMAQQKLKY